MQVFVLSALFCVLSTGLLAADDAVVVTIEGKPYKKSELESFLKALPPSVFQNFSANKKNFLETFALMVKLSSLAEQKGLDKQNPHQARLDYNRWQYLATAMINDQDSAEPVNGQDVKASYEATKDSLAQAKTKVLYIAFNNSPMASPDPKAKKPLTDVQAKAKAEALLKELRGGADFAKIIEANSDDADSRDKAGDFPVIKKSEAGVPAALKDAVFALKPGEYTSPIQQPNGFYIFRLEEIKIPPYEEIQQELTDKFRRARLDKWIESTKKSVKIEFNDEKYLSEPAQK